jgi:glucose-6-phosphate 1-dehydrogenase
MLPNHLFQLVCLTAMEPPVSFDANVVRDEQAKILKALQPFQDRDVLLRAVRGQYGLHQAMAGYRQEPMVAPGSRTETYLALKRLSTIGVGPTLRLTSAGEAEGEAGHRDRRAI